ncbi:MAG: hypothetical protein ABSA83_19235 [Verrucomicrobiota bacterium]
MKSLLRYPAAWREKSNPGRKGMPLAGLLSKSGKSIFNRLFPTGYEDDAGFHYGMKPPEKSSEQRDSAGNQL